MLTLEGRSCKLRPVERSDMAASLTWRNDPETRDLVMGYKFPVTEVMESGWYDRVLADQGGKRASFTIASLDGEAIGFVHLTDIDWIARGCELGIVIGNSGHRGRGVGREALALAVRYACHTLNLNRITAHVLERNAPARRMFESVGFSQEGLMRDAAFSQGHQANVVVFGLLKREFVEDSAET